MVGPELELDDAMRDDAVEAARRLLEQDAQLIVGRLGEASAVRPTELTERVAGDAEGCRVGGRAVAIDERCAPRDVAIAAGESVALI